MANVETFAGRAAELAAIEEMLGLVRRGEKTNICFLGVPGSGKTALLRRYVSMQRQRWEEEGVILVYVSLNDLGESPHELASGFVGDVLARVAFTLKTDLDITALRRPETFANCASRIRSRAVKGFLTALEELPAGVGGAQQGLVLNAFGFPNAFAEEKRIRLILFVDDFGELRKYSNPAMAAFDEFHMALRVQTEAFYVTAMNHSPFADKIFSDPVAPLRSSFSVAHLHGLAPAEAREAAMSMLNLDPGEQELRSAGLIADLSGGNPLLLKHLASAAAEAAAGGAPSESQIADAFASELLSPLGRIYRHFLSNLQNAVGAKADYITARKVLAILAEGRALKPEVIRKKAGIDVETTARVVGRVLASGLFRKVDETFYFDDPLFRFWALKTDPDEDQGRKDKDKAKAREFALEYLNRFRPGTQKASAGPAVETGAEAPQGSAETAPAPHAEPAPAGGAAPAAAAPAPVPAPAAAPAAGTAQSRKFNFRDLISACKGRTVPGELLGSEGEVRFPDFGNIKGFAFSTRQVKMYYLEGGGECWAMLVVWWAVKADREQIEVFTGKAAGRMSKLWFICRGGFTREAMEAARKASVYTSGEKDLVKLLENLT